MYQSCPSHPTESDRMPHPHHPQCRIPSAPTPFFPRQQPGAALRRYKSGTARRPHQFARLRVRLPLPAALLQSWQVLRIVLIGAALRTSPRTPQSQNSQTALAHLRLRSTLAGAGSSGTNYGTNHSASTLLVTYRRRRAEASGGGISKEAHCAYCAFHHIKSFRIVSHRTTSYRIVLHRIRSHQARQARACTAANRSSMPSPVMALTPTDRICATHTHTRDLPRSS